tara:strand:+ start:1783 stop:2247 length:465 start_codon:yes stop_codon:yes gene_type:complete
MEVWRTIPGFTDYEVSNFGNIYGGRWGHEKKQHYDNDGYKCVRLYDVNKYQKHLRVHRLVAQAFIPNQDNKPEVDHINRIRDDNNVTNLRWVDDSQQAINRNNKIANTGHRNINKNGIGFIVRIKRYGEFVYSKHFTTLEEAIIARDNFLMHGK